MIPRNQQILLYQIMKTQASFILLVKIYLKSLGELIYLVDIMTYVASKEFKKVIETKLVYQIRMAAKKSPSQLKIYLHAVVRVYTRR